MFGDEDYVDQDGDAGNLSSEEEGGVDMENFGNDDDEDSADDGNNDVDGSGNDDDEEEKEEEEEEEDNENTEEEDDEIVFNFKSQKKPKQSLYEAKSLQRQTASAEKTKKTHEEVESDKDLGQEGRDRSDETESDDQDSAYVNEYYSVQTSDSDSDVELPKAKRKKKDNSGKRKNKKKVKKDISSVEHMPVEDVFTGRKKGTKLKKTNLMEVEGTEDNSVKKTSLSKHLTTETEEYDEDSDERVETESMDDSEERTLDEASLEMENEAEEEGTLVSNQHRQAGRYPDRQTDK